MIHVNKPLEPHEFIASYEWGVDIETSSLDPFDGRLLSIALFDGTDVWIFLDFFGFDSLISLLENLAYLKIFHNAKFDMRWLKHKLGVDVQNVWDTMIIEQALTKGKDLPASLDEVIARRLGIMIEKETRDTFIEHPGFKVQPVTNAQLNYMAQDVIHLIQLREQQFQQADREKCLWMVEIENSILPAVVEMELGGIKLDVDLWFQYVEIMEKRLEELDELERQEIGDFVLTFPSKSKLKPHVKEYTADEIKFGSPEQMKHLLKDRFGLNLPNTRKETLREVEGVQFVSYLLETRKWAKRLGYGYDKFIHPLTGKVHAQYHQMGTITGRFSSSQPNMQQVAKPNEMEELENGD
jgi:DNA polymerase-1